MRLLLKNSKFAIYDDVLPKEEFQQLWGYVQEEHYAQPQSQGNWLKVWRIGDCSPMGSRSYYKSEAPFNLPLDNVAKKIEQAGADNPELIKPFEDVVYRNYLYPRGCKLSWHDDSTVYCGAATYYTHPKWGSTWGGELMVAEVPPLASAYPKGVNKPHMDHQWEDDYINIFGMGQYVVPKPNRLVIMAPGVYHAINRVDADAGDHPRCSVVGFYLKDKKKAPTPDK